MRVLGISCGRRMGNTEIMVKEALMGAGETGAEVELIHLHDLNIKPCTGCNSCVLDLLERCGPGRCAIKNDDLSFFEERFLECDGLIVGSPIYEKSPSGQLKCLNDRMGPRADQAMRMGSAKMRAERGITSGEGPDPRSFKPRLASLIAVGGSEWDTLALPLLNLFVLPMQVKVVDQILVNWVGLPGVITLRPDLLERAHMSGKHLAESLKKPVEEAEYIGEPGMCPVCHSKVIEVRTGEDYPIICGVCGVKGTLAVDGGQVRFTVAEDEVPRSHVLLSGKFEHLNDLAQMLSNPPADMCEIPSRLAKYKKYLSYSKPPR